MPLQLRMLNIPPSCRPCRSIREALETDAWDRHPDLASRLARRKARRSSTRRSLRWQDRTLLILAVTLMALLLIRVETASADEPWGLELRTSAGNTTSLALETSIRVDVTGLIARVEVSQEFLNEGSDWAEGVYRFPLPDGAAVDRLLVRLGGRTIEGEIREKSTARRVYQQALADGHAASLVEQQRVNQFESRLVNIGPGEEIQVTIGFLASVHYGSGAFSLRLPMTFTPRWTPGGTAPIPPQAPRVPLTTAQAGVHRGLELDVLLRTGIGYAAIESRYHDVDIRPQPGGYRIVLVNPAELPDRDFELTWLPDFTSVPQTVLATWDGGDAVYALMMLVPPFGDAIGPQPREVVFIIDTSGSMEGASLEQARAALARGLAQLDGNDRFNLIQFNSRTELLFPGSVRATQHNRYAAAQYIAGLSANGGTVMAPALRSAFALPARDGLLRQVVFVTDGSVGNEHELLADIAAQLGESRLFTVAIGSAPNSWFMRKAAQIGRGSHTHIGNLEEVEERMTGLWAHIRLPALTDICVDWGQDAEFYPEVIPDLYAQQPLWLVARLPLQPREVRLCGVLNGEFWEHHVAPSPAQGSETLATLWARRKIESLEDSATFGFDAASVREQITRVALDYGLLTAHTSLVAIDGAPARGAGQTLARGMIPSLLPAGSTQTSAGFPPTAAGWRARLSLSLLALLIVSAMYLCTPGIARRDLKSPARAARQPLGPSPDAAP